MKSSNAVVAFPDAGTRRRDHELAFLPAALEIVETPPSPVGRAIGATIIAVFVLALAWACLGTVDIVATASGKIIPSGRTKIIQPFEIGVVRAIHVRDGDTVKVGQVLIELDPTMNAAEREHLQSDLIAAQLAALDRQLAQKEAERATSAATIGKIEAVIPLLQQQLDMRKTLFDHETGSKLVYLQTLQQLVEQQQERAVQKSKFNEAEAAVAAIRETRAQAKAEFRRTLFDDLGKIEPKAAGLAQDLIKAEQRTRLQALTAPVDGIVQQLAVHTVGGVVTPAQPLLVLVPQDSHLEIEAMVSNRDVGFVEPGQEAEIKVATFNFTRYGRLHGNVLSVSPDAVGRDDPQGQTKDKSPQGTQDAKPASDDQGPVYAARIALDRTQMQIEDKPVNLSPGMTVTAEIRTGERRIISYLLSPLRKYRQDSLRER